MKDRPYVVCHVLSSIDGRISGSLFSAAETMQANTVYGDIRRQYDIPAVMNGTVTSAQIYADGYVDVLPEAEGPVTHEDYVAKTDLDRLVVCTDPQGTLKWHRNYIERSGEKSHVVEILTEAVSDQYIACLRKLEISYVFAGAESLDLPLAMRKLKSEFGVDRLLVTGGGVMDWSLLQAGVLDELSLVVAPVVTGERDRATSFDQSAFSPANGPIPMELAAVKSYPGGTLWLNYKRPVGD